MLGHGTCVTHSAEEVYSYAATWQIFKTLSTFSSNLNEMRLYFLRKLMTLFISHGLDECTINTQLEDNFFFF